MASLRIRSRAYGIIANPLSVRSAARQLNATRYNFSPYSALVLLQHLAPTHVTNFIYSFDLTLSPQKIQNAILIHSALSQTCEDDFLVLQSAFGTTGGFGPANHILVWVTDTNVKPGGGHSYGYGEKDGQSQVSISSTATGALAARWVFVLELGEIFMSYHARTGGQWNSLNSMGEALSVFLGNWRYPGSGGVSIGAWLNDRSHPVTKGRADWINATEGVDTDQVSFGCGLLFLHWLHTRKQFNVVDIIKASAPTFAQLYRQLTGSASDAWTDFTTAVNAIYPESSTRTYSPPSDDIFAS